MARNDDRNSRCTRGMLTLGCVLVLAACDPQASTAYRGEALLTMTGKVEIQNDATEGRLIPALAFVNPEHSEIRIADVEVEGEFPSSFTLHVYDPPPDEAFSPASDGAPASALAFITAVTESHPETLRFGGSGSSTASGTTSCTPQACGCGPDGCVTMSQLCTNDNASCYTETRTCPRADSPPEDCTTTHSGDASLAQNPWKHFAGLSQNYEIVYLKAPIEKDSDLALGLGLKDGLAAGYNLVAVRVLTDEEIAQQAQCNDTATHDVVARFNEQLGNPATTPAEIDQLQRRLEGLECNLGDNPKTIPPECVPLDAKVVAAFAPAVAKLQRERDCTPIGVNLAITKVADPEHESVTVQIAPGLEPIGGAWSTHDAMRPPVTPPSSGTAMP